MNASQEALSLSEKFSLLVRTQKSAIIWRRLLQWGAEQPQLLLSHLLPLVESEPILASPDTSTEAGSFLHEVYPLLDKSQRERIEGLILRLPTSTSIPQHSRHGGTRRDYLLGCLPLEFVSTEAAKCCLGELQQNNRMPSDVSQNTKCQFEGWLESTNQEPQDVSNDSPATTAYREKINPLVVFREQWTNAIPSMGDIDKIFPLLAACANSYERIQTIRPFGIWRQTGAKRLLHVAFLFCRMARSFKIPR